MKNQKTGPYRFTAPGDGPNKPLSRHEKYASQTGHYGNVTSEIENVQRIIKAFMDSTEFSGQ